MEFSGFLISWESGRCSQVRCAFWQQGSSPGCLLIKSRVLQDLQLREFCAQIFCKVHKVANDCTGLKESSACTSTETRLQRENCCIFRALCYFCKVLSGLRLFCRGLKPRVPAIHRKCSRALLHARVTRLQKAPGNSASNAGNYK